MSASRRRDGTGGNRLDSWPKRWMLDLIVRDVRTPEADELHATQGIRRLPRNGRFWAWGELPRDEAKGDTPLSCGILPHDSGSSESQNAAAS